MTISWVYRQNKAGVEARLEALEESFRTSQEPEPKIQTAVSRNSLRRRRLCLYVPRMCENDAHTN
jgi:hypothetical protein